MLMFVTFALVLGLAAAYVYREKQEDMVHRLAAGVLLCFAGYFLYQAVYYWQIGESVRNFYNGGAGIDVVNGSTTTTFFSSSDPRVAEYMALQRGDVSVIMVLSPLLPVLAVFVTFYSAYWILQKFYFGRGEEG
ncbi:Uncharacterised protein [Candidatus Anstonella stagnisolia]|nr:Uncharacterised protein [Candidatus Anstonella stagnisolia]